MNRLLLHSCCAPCTVSVYKLLSKSFDTTLFWYNPNIHPITEYKKRLNSFIDLTKIFGAKSIIKDEYVLDSFLQKIAFRESFRCNICYYERLKYGFSIAKSGKYDYFSTTLLYSKYQNHNKIVKTCKALSIEYGVDFFYQDFRNLWESGIKESIENKFYRQSYCGCIYSEHERYR